MNNFLRREQSTISGVTKVQPNAKAAEFAKKFLDKFKKKDGGEEGQQVDSDGEPKIVEVDESQEQTTPTESKVDDS